jgi:small subunit ribosomal protein S20
MPMNKSMAKRLRQSLKRRDRNRTVRTRVAHQRRNALQAIQSGDADAARVACREAARSLDKSVSKGVLHKKTAARRKARLMKHLATALAEPETVVAHDEEAETEDEELEEEESDEDEE